MKTKKLLSMLLTLCIVLSTIGALSISASAAANITKTVNVPQNVTYTLPATVDGQAVTWSPATVDTSKIGYRLYTGTLADNTTVTYRVNVGEWKTYMYDNMNNLYGRDNDNVWSNNVIKVTEGIGFVYRRANNDSSYVINACGVKESDGNYVVAFGPGKSTPSYMIWWPQIGNFNDEYKISYKVKVADYNLLAQNGSGSQSVHKMTLGPSTEGTQLWVVEGGDSASFSSLRIYANGDKTADIPTECYTYTIEDGILNTSYIDVSLIAFDNTYSVKIGDRELISQSAWKKQDKTFNRLDVGKSTSEAEAPGKAYFDDFSVSRLIYVTDTIENKSAAGKTAQNAPAAQTATVALTMSDGSTKDFTVNYTADTATAGENKTAQGTIDGFDGTIPVTYSVVGVVEQTINTFIGADVKLADGSKADTSAFGRKYYRATTNSGIIDYTVNVGRYDSKVTDNMERHTSTTLESKNIETIKSGSADGLNLLVTNSASDGEYSATVVKESGNQWIKFDKYTPSNHLDWEVVDGFDGDGRVSVKVMYEGNAGTTNTGSTIRIYDSNGVQMTHAFSTRLYENDVKLFFMNDGHVNNKPDTNVLKWYDA